MEPSTPGRYWRCWCERHHVGYIVGIARNKRLNVLSQPLRNQALRAYEDSGDKQRLFDEFFYAAGTWDRRRRVIVKAEHTARGSNPRYIVTNLAGSPPRSVVTVQRSSASGVVLPGRHAAQARITPLQGRLAPGLFQAPGSLAPMPHNGLIPGKNTTIQRLSRPVQDLPGLVAPRKRPKIPFPSCSQRNG